MVIIKYKDGGLSSDYFGNSKDQFKFKKRRNFMKLKEEYESKQIAEKEESDEIAPNKLKFSRVACYIIGLEIDMKSLLENSKSSIIGIKGIEEYK